MQLSSISASDRLNEAIRGSEAAGRSQRPAGVSRTATNTDGFDSSTRPAPTKYLASWAPEINRQVATAQQTTAFLDRLSAQLNDFKNQVSQQLAAGLVNEGKLQSMQLQIDGLWQQRVSMSAGGLDDRLQFFPDANAPKHFSIKGLDSRSVQDKGDETLVFSLQGPSRKVFSVRIEQGVTLHELAADLNSALAVFGVRVGVSHHGELDFTIDTHRWAEIQGSLTVRGEGKRFPTGQFAMIRMDPERPAITPSAWSLDSLSGLRQTLPKVIKALELTDKAKTESTQSLQAAENTLKTRRPSISASGASTFAQGVASLIKDGRYTGFSSLVGGIQGLPRYRVEGLLPVPWTPN